MIAAAGRGVVEAYIALGSNLENPQAQIASALHEIATVPGIHLEKQSRFYDTTPVGGPDGQPDYINAAALIETSLSPTELLLTLQEIELQHGRVRSERWGARTLDLDILLYDALAMETADLTIPHPRMHERAFVLIPLLDVADAELAIPGHGPLGDLVAKLSSEGVRLHEG